MPKERDPAGESPVRSGVPDLSTGDAETDARAAVPAVMAWDAIVPDQPAAPPVAKRVPEVSVLHGDEQVDDYAWLAALRDPAVIRHLEAENAYFAAETAHLEPLQEAILAKLCQPAPEAKAPKPWREGDYWYYTRSVAGKPYRVECRCPAGAGDEEAPQVPQEESLPGEQVVLDQNELADGHEYLALGSYKISTDGNVLMYSADATGAERFTLRFKDLRTGTDLGAPIPDTARDAILASAGTHAFYCTSDENGRESTVWRHRIGGGEPDVRVWHEPDERFFVTLGGTHSGKYYTIRSNSSDTTEELALETSNPEGEFAVILPRSDGVNYRAEHAVIDGADKWLIRHNGIVNGERAANFALATAPVDDSSQLTALLAPSGGASFEHVTVGAQHALIRFRENALPQLGILPLSGEGAGELRTLDLGELPNPEGSIHDWDSPVARIKVQSWLGPEHSYTCDLATGQLTPDLERRSADGYMQSRDWARAADGTLVPLTIIKRVEAGDAGPAKPRPTVLYVYGDRGNSLDAHESDFRQALIDRGVVFVYAHVRGGGEMGPGWYEDGKLLKKRNSITDFVASAQHLVDRGETTPKQMAAAGASAGGLVVAGAVNMAPKLFAGVLAEAPAVDPIASLLDVSDRATINNWGVWGNPYERETYEYLKSYSPYGNVGAREYPPLFVTTSINDPRVPYHGPVKWVAKLRAATTGTAPVLVQTAMAGGHFGGSGEQALRDEALKIAWLLTVTGAASPRPPDSAPWQRR